MTDSFAGSRWWKFDFHTHTPHSSDWGNSASKDSHTTPQDWLLHFMHAEIDCVAITDHNGGGWIDRLKSAYADLVADPPEGFRPLYLFPGVEITVATGEHLLALFDRHAGSSDVTGLLAVVGCTTAQGDASQSARMTMHQALDEVAGRGGIAIPAHVDDRKTGLFRPSGHNPAQPAGSASAVLKLLDSPHLTAIELRDPAFVMPACCSEAVRCPTKVVGSDWHGRADQEHLPGARYTWVKMGDPSLEGLKLALLDGAPLSILRHDDPSLASTTSNPNRFDHWTISSLTIREARTAGIRAPLDVAFSPWLTTLIGGRGSGKSTVIEFLRLAMGRRDRALFTRLPELERFFKAAAGRDDDGALTDSTSLTVRYNKGPHEFRITFHGDGSPTNIEERCSPGDWQPADTVVGNFPVRIYSQKQIFHLAQDPRALIAVMDEAPEMQKADWNSRFQSARSAFLSLRARRRELEAQLTDRPRLKGELDDCLRQIAVFEEGDNRDTLRTFQRHRRQQSVLDRRGEELADAVTRLRELAPELEPSDVSADEFDHEDQAEKTGLALLEEAAESQRALMKRILELAEEHEARLRAWQEKRTESAWHAATESSHAAHQTLLEALAQQGIEDPKQYGVLTQRRQALEKKLAGLKATETLMEGLDSQCAERLEEIQGLRLELSQKRREFLHAVLRDNEFVRMELHCCGKTAAAAETNFRLAIRKDDGKFGPDIYEAQSPGRDKPERGVLADLYSELPERNDADRDQRILAEIASLKARLLRVAQGGEDDALGGHFKNYLREKLRPEDLDHLQTWWPEDELRVEYKPDVKGKFQPIGSGSPGQKSAAILAFVLSHGNEPIVLDQPEDDLDNELIYSLIVRQIRSMKSRRQVIIATHNPNIVVHGDAEQVLAMEFHKGECVVSQDASGSLQELTVRKRICDVMEGGKSAFDERHRRVSLEGPPRV